MLNDFEMIIHKFPDRPDLDIVPVSDVHLGASEHMWDAWERFRKGILERPNTYIVLGGDLINNATRSSVSNVFQETLRPRDQKRLMVEQLAPLRDRILCAVTGNHERRSGRDADDDATYDILCKLDLEHLYRESMAFVKIQMGQRDSNGIVNPTYMLVVTHGAGGGMTGAAVNRSERFGYVLDGADALIVGHTHKPFVTQPSKILIDKNNNKISLRPFKVICSTAWLDYGGYAAEKMLLPSGHAPQTIHLAGRRKEITVTM